MNETIAAILLLMGSFFMLIAALGVLRLHDVYMRMHAITKASSLAIVLFLIALIVLLPGLRVILGSLLLIFFVIATAPISSHALARVSVQLGIKPASGRAQNDLEKAFQREKHSLK
jgi:multicomponent Na+:H+ antiporter subunit G